MIITIILLQIIYGAFTAGLKAGYGWNTFPKMAGEWIPDRLFSISPWYLNFVEDNFKGNDNYKKLVQSSAFCSEENNIVGDDYKITKEQNIGIIPPIGGG